MNMTALRLIAALGLASFATPASAQVYVSAHGGLSSPDTVHHKMDKSVLTVEVDDGGRIGGAIGYDFGNFRLELEGSHAAASVAYITDGKRRGLTTGKPHRRDAIMANAYWTPRVNDHVRIVLGAGVGVSDNFMRAALGEPCKEVIAVRYTVNPESDRTGPSGKECIDQGKSGNRGITGQGIAGLDFGSGRWTIGPQFRYVRSFGVTESGKDQPNRQVRHETRTDPATWEALFAVTYRLGSR